MFTIRHNRADGTEEIFQAVSVQHIPPYESFGNCAGLHLLAAPGEAETGVRVGTLRDGTVFVMNDKGATVGRFDLGLPPPPPAVDRHGHPYGEQFCGAGQTAAR